MKKSKRILVKIRKTKRAAIADMKKVLLVGGGVLQDMLNEPFISIEALNEQASEDR